MIEEAQTPTATDPVCGMVVEIEDARAKGLWFEHDRTTYYFCGKGCRLEFEEAPGKYLDPSYEPSM